MTARALTLLLPLALVAPTLAAGCAGAAPRPSEAPAVTTPDDRCPEADEDLDQFEDDDGCPDPDNDEDAVLDVADLCPCNVEDVDGWEDADGCPDPDDDQDRIPDACDRCPRDAEIYNGTCDEDGCPDHGRVCLMMSEVRILERVPFARGRATIAPEESPRLEALAMILRENPELERVDVVGHAQIGEPRAARLATDRATAVRDAIVARGVEAQRLTMSALPPESGDGDTNHGRFVGFAITQYQGTPWPSGRPPAGWGCGAPYAPTPNEPADCAPLPACTYVEDDRCAPRPPSADAPTPR